MSNRIYVNNYMPYYPVNNYTLDDTLLRNKYEKIKNDKKNYFNEAKVINFDIINHECRGDPLEYSIKHYQTIYEENLQRSRKEDINEFIGEAIKSRREDLHVDKEVSNEHFKLDQKLIDFKLKNKILFSSMHKKYKNKSQLSP